MCSIGPHLNAMMILALIMCILIAGQMVRVIVTMIPVGKIRDMDIQFAA